MNDLFALADAVRDRYLEALLETLSAFKREHEVSAAEAMLEMQRDVPLPFRLYRADMVANDGGKIEVQDMNCSTHLSFEPFGIEPNEGVTVAVSPFVWNDIALHINTNMPHEPVEAWAMRWLDMDDLSPDDENGLQSVIHSIVREDRADGSTLLMIDFGSAPVEALKQIVELAFAVGASHVSVYSQTLQ